MKFEAAREAAEKASKSFLTTSTIPCPLLNTGLLVLVIREDTQDVIEGARVALSGTGSDYEKHTGEKSETTWVQKEVAVDAEAVVEETGFARFLPCKPGNYQVAVVDLAGQEAELAFPDAVDQRVPAQECPVCTIIVPPRALELTRVDDHFAPGHEALDIGYRLKGYEKDEVVLTITSSRYGSDPLLKRTLVGGEKKDGDHTFDTWKGKIDEGPSKDLFIHPLLAPFTVTLSSGGKSSKKDFKVLYHSIKIRRGPWTPDEAPPDKGAEKEWLQYWLDELGYVGGPVGKDSDDYLKKAIVRYKANHPKLVKLDYKDYDDAVTTELKEAIEAKEAKRDYLGDEAFGDEEAESKVRIESLTYYGDEFSGSQRWVKDKERLNRPLVPIEVDIFIKAKNDSAAPREAAAVAVGPARITFRFSDPDEDLSGQFAPSLDEPSRTKDYLKEALSLEQGRTSTKGDNCPATFGGLRVASDDYGFAPFLLGDAYVPWTVEKDTTQHVVYSKACIDGGKHPKRLGRAGVMLRTSIIAGDAYKVEAELDFTGIDGQKALEELHGIDKPAARPRAKTGTFRVWRTNRVTMLVDWPARNKPPANHASHAWDEVKAEFAKAYVDIDVGSIVTKSITDVLSADDYKDVVAANTKHTDKGLVTLNADAMVGVDLPVQNEPLDTYKTLLKQYVNADYCDKIKKPLQAKLSEKIRKTHANGFIVVPFLTHKPVDLKEDPGTGKNDVKMAGAVLATSSISQDDSLVYVDQKDPDLVYCVTAHEMGHNFFLKHWENAPGRVILDHDVADHNCMMSYTGVPASQKFAHQAPGAYKPHFCGKCNLKLRGWDISNLALPRRAPLDTVLVLTVAVDNANPKLREYVNYTITIENQGPRKATGVKVADDSPDHIVRSSFVASKGAFDTGSGIWTVGDMEVSDKETLTVRVWVWDTSKDVDAVDYPWYVVAPVESAGAIESAKYSVTTVALDPWVYIAVADPSVGEEIEISVSVENKAVTKATGVKGTLTLPVGLTYVSFSGATQGTYDTVTSVWTIGELAKDAKAEAKVACRVDVGTEGRSLDVKLVATAVEPDKNASRGGATRAVKVAATPMVALGPSVYCYDSDPSVNDDIKLSVSVENKAVTRATGVKGTLTLPVGLTFKTFSDATKGTYESSTGVWTIGELAKDEKAEAKVVCHVEPSNEGKSLDVKLVATAVETDRNASSGGATRAVKIAATPMVALGTWVYCYDSNPSVGDDATISISVENKAATKATGVKGTLTLPVGLTFKSFSDATKGTYESSTGVWTIGDLVKDEKAEAKVAFHVEAGARGKTLDVKLVAAADQVDRNASSGGSTRQVTVSAIDKVKLTILFYASPGDPAAGGAVTLYAYVKNESGNDATGAKAVLTLPGDLAFVRCAAPSHGAFDGGSLTWTIGALDAGVEASAKIECSVHGGAAGKALQATLTVSADQPNSNYTDHSDETINVKV